MCCDTVGAITTSSDKGSLINSIIITMTRNTLLQKSFEAKKGQQ